jgi:zinc-ribbon domain
MKPASSGAACPSCGREVPPDSTYCSWCGAALAGPAPETGSSAVGGEVSTDVPPGDPTVLHRGRAFLVAETGDAYGVWQAAGGTAVIRWARTPEGWQAAWRRFTELEAGAARGELPDWRGVHAGWVILHLLVGLAIGIVTVLVAVALVVAGGRDVNPLTTQTAVACTVAIVGALAGWILFVYLRTGTGLRWAVFTVAVGLSFLLALGVGLASQPPS